MAHLIRNLANFGERVFSSNNRVRWCLQSTSFTTKPNAQSFQFLTRSKSYFKKNLDSTSACKRSAKNVLQNSSVIRKVNKRRFHTSGKRYAIPGLIVMILRPLSKILAFIVGRGFRKWYQSLPKDKKSLVKAYLKRNWMTLTVVSGGIVGGSVLYYESHIYETPITHRRRFLVFTDKQFKEITDFEFKTYMEEYGEDVLPTSDPVYSRVLKVANKLLESNKDLKQIYDKKWSVTVVDQDIKNAFVLACGQVFVFTGMLDVCANDDQLGIILGHEMAHCILKHGIELVSWAHLIDLLVLLPVIAIWAIIPSDSVALLSQYVFSKVTELLLTLPYGRLLEAEADEVGLCLAAKACFDVRESSAFWGTMAALGETIEEGKSGQDWLSTHPSHSTRQVNLDKLIPHAILIREKCKCEKLPMRDPRDYVPEKREQTKTIQYRTPMLVR